MTWQRHRRTPRGPWVSSITPVLWCEGDHFEHWLNGVKVVAGSLSGPEVAASAARRWGVGSPVYELLARQPRRDCQISLQNHNSEAWFRNIKIRRLR